MAVLGSQPAVVCVDLPQTSTGAGMLAFAVRHGQKLDKPPRRSPGRRRARLTHVVVSPCQGVRRPKPGRSCRRPPGVRVAAVVLAVWRPRRIDGRSAGPDAQGICAERRRSGDHRDYQPGCAKALRPGHADEPLAALPNDPGRTQCCGPWHAVGEGQVRPVRPTAMVRGAAGVTRTLDLLITNQLLYQLSYSSVLQPGRQCPAGKHESIAIQGGRGQPHMVGPRPWRSPTSRETSGSCR